MARTPNNDLTPPAPEPLDLREESLNRTLRSLALPAILENLMFTLVFFCDTLIVGWLRDEHALAAAVLAGSVMYLLNAPFYALGIAANSLVARCWGGSDFSRGRRFAGQSLMFSALLAVGLLLVVMPQAGPLIRLLGGEGDVEVMGAMYLRIVLLSSLLGLPMILASGIIRGTGDARTPMRITVVMNLTNIAASVLLAFGIGPLPELGLVGVAWGTVVARSLGGLLALRVLVSRRRGPGLVARDFIDVRWAILTSVVRLAGPAMLDRVLHTLSHLVFIRIVAMLGATALAAHNIAMHVESLAFMPAIGVGSAAATVLGQAMGARLPHVAELAVRRTLIWSGVAMLGLGAVFVLFAPSGVAAFGATPGVLRQAGLALQISALELPFLAFAIILSASLRGAGDTRSPLCVTLVCLVLFRLGVVYLFAIPFGWGLAGVWLGTAVDWAGRTAGLWWFFRRGVWKRIHEEEKRREAEMAGPKP